MADNQPTSSGISLRTILFGTAAAGAILAIGGAIWFDNKRRSDPELRKKLGGPYQSQDRLRANSNGTSSSISAKQKREAAKKQAIEEEQAKAQAMESARSAAGKISVEDDEPAPTNPEEREQYFMEQLQKGEMAFRQGGRFVGMLAFRDVSDLELARQLCRLIVYLTLFFMFITSFYPRPGILRSLGRRFLQGDEGLSEPDGPPCPLPALGS